MLKVEIGNFRIVDKGSLHAFFSVLIHPMKMKVLDCRYFIHGDSRWFNFPQKEIKYSDGRKTEYIPLVSFANKEYQDQLKSAILEALKEAKPTGNNGTKKNNAYQEQKSPVHTQPSFEQDELPF